MVTFDPLLLEGALNESSNIVIRTLKSVPETGPDDEQLASIGLQFLDPNTIPDRKIRNFWSRECSRLEEGDRRKRRAEG